jgi:hypothetical protein
MLLEVRGPSPSSSSSRPRTGYALSLSFTRPEVDEDDLIAALESILANLRSKKS